MAANALFSIGDAQSTHVRMARLAHVDEHGRCWVELSGGPDGPVPARLTSAAAKVIRHAPPGAPLLVVHCDDCEEPFVVDVIVDCVADAVEASVPDEPAPSAIARPSSVDTTPAQRVIEAKEDITLRCGRASLVLQRTGKIVLKGDYVLTYSRGTNRIKGGSVQIN